ncbi:rod shape-determining protein MreC [Sutcliffiella horikoshii]|uniref:Cell shape-determining protein MreC n=1 Tax=Sutcliffiella horikoshii TaxID=79883 RepID=A0A1Y0CQ35_9BACI|nr:rod shape-determining protein MreC [Sutcliffiella horikoshii]ART77460.1 rod shape-determining protein MreC [Sutcliffiella horikoshii]TYS59095.1 rod shape-determining protein MreC [Sutcliffiella horikoshii]
MPQFFLNKRLIILLVSLIFLVALIGFSLKERDDLTWPEQFVKDSTGFVQSIFYRPAHVVAGFFDNVGYLKDTYEENKLLRARLEEYALLETKVQKLEQENEEFREVIGELDSLSDYEPKPATVIGRNPDQWVEQITVNKGKQNGVEKDMAVITSGGLIGKIKQANAFTSTVQLLSSLDPKNRISAYIQGEEDIFGLIEGYDEEKGALLLKRIPHQAEVKEGETVLSSGLGGVFPEGLMIGEVTEVVADEYGLTQMAYVKPAADFYDINQVMIVKRTLISGDEPVESEEEASEDEEGGSE